MASVNLPTDLLRTFVTVIELAGYTRAAETLGRTQPAISLQMRRLEQLVGAKLVSATGRGFALTEEGERLALYARQILRLNDEAVASFAAEPAADGALRVGLPTDFANAFLQEAIVGFGRARRELDLQIVCDLSRSLRALIAEEALDVAVALIADGDVPHLVAAWAERPIWAAAAGTDVHTRTPLPLVAHPEGCEYRERMIEALAGAGRRWRIAYTSPAIEGLQDAVSAGLGVSALTRKTLRPDMRALGSGDGLPALAPIRIGLFAKQARHGGAARDLVAHLGERLAEAAGPAPETGKAPGISAQNLGAAQDLCGH